jgi:drug/metabolite transporter (DMT)-like permease
VGAPRGADGPKGLDLFGGASLVGVMLLLAFNQLLIKQTNVGLQPVFAAGLRSAVATVCVGLWLWRRGRLTGVTRAVALEGTLMGMVFAGQFLCLFLALDLTSVSHASIIFYSMPVWLAFMSHVWLPGDRMTLTKGVGLAMAFAGTVAALFTRGDAAAGASIAGDLLALGAALGWAAQTVIARRPVMAEAGAEQQLFWMVLVSAPILLLVSPAFGPLVRALQPMHVVALLFQGAVVVSGGFIAFLWLLSVYAPTTVASFSFLTPIFGLAIGRLLLSEPLGARIVVACLLVGAGILLINYRPSATARAA